MLVYLAIGVFFALSVVCFERLKKNGMRHRKKKAPSSFLTSLKAFIFFLGGAVLLWPIILCVLIWDAKLKKDGVTFGVQGGGYTREKISWREYLINTYRSLSPNGDRKKGKPRRRGAD